MRKQIEMNQEHEVVLYQIEGTNICVNVMFKEETFWMTQKAMANLFDCTTDNISLHLKNIYKEEELEEEAPGSVCFLCFDELNPDTQIVLTPTTVNTVIWNKFLELSFGDFAKIIAPSQIVFCEGTKRGRKYKDFDAQIYTKIFFSSYPDTSFISIVESYCEDG